MRERGISGVQTLKALDQTLKALDQTLKAPDQTLKALRRVTLCLLMMSPSIVTADYFDIGEGLSADDGGAVKYSYRMFTAPDLSELPDRLQTLYRLRVEPELLCVPLESRFQLEDLRVFAESRRGEAIAAVPLKILISDDATRFLTFDGWRTFGEGLTPLSPGKFDVMFRTFQQGFDGKLARTNATVTVDFTCP